MDRPWLKRYPAGVPATVPVDGYPSLAALIDEGLSRHAQRVACRFMGRAISYAQVDASSRALAAWLQGLGLGRGDRVAVMLPNVPQYLVAATAILRAGMVVVNVNPMYTPRELQHQLKDSGAKAIVVLENFAATLQQVIDAVPTKHVLLTSTGDMLGVVRRRVVDHVARKVKKMVPPFHLPGAVRFAEAIAAGRRRGHSRPSLGPDDVAVLQYTGGTTGVSKGAVLLHRNLLANVLQAEAWYQPALRRIAPDEQPTTVCALPLYHIFGFSSCMLLALRVGGCLLLVPNARDIPSLLREIAKVRFHSFPGVNTLFNAITQHPDARSVDWSSLVLSVGGGMAVQASTAQRWQALTGVPIVEGYGLSETSPSVCCNPMDSTGFSGTIGLPLPNTEVKLIDDEGREVPPGTPGEIAIRGPQVMAGYWQRPDETAKVMTRDGFLRSGDIGVMDARGHFRIVDRKKDLILVSGFNVYPNEVEEVVAQMSGVVECAAIGVPDERAGEAVKLVVVRRDDSLTAADVKAHCDAHLTGYKRPRIVEFRSELPKTPVGKILRRELREGAPAR